MSTDRGLIRARGRAALFPTLLVTPAWIVLIVFTFYPLVLGVMEAFKWHNLYIPWKEGYAGLSHFKKIFADPLFYLSLKNSIMWVVGSTLIQFALGLAAALLLNQKFRLRGLARAAALSPWAVSGVLTGLMWAYMFHGQVGIINDFLIKLGMIDRPIAWLSQLSTSLPATIFANTWAGMTFFVIAMLSALQMIPDELYEAAAIDGAGRWQSFRQITIPLIKDMIVLSTILQGLANFKQVGLIWIMTGGGPANKTMTLPVYVFNTAKTTLDYGYGAALGIVMAIILMILSVFYLKFTRFGSTEGAL
jgi:multiple sugar transport system permease protein